jgi:tRNA dimethylallyltransferase
LIIRSVNVRVKDKNYFCQTLTRVHTKKLIVIAGPTAVGKTDVAIRLAGHFHTEIVSADARQLYKELNIGTAKPSAHDLAQVRHHFISSHSIHEHYNAATYGEDALVVIRKLFADHDYVILCGGSGLYIKALLEGFDDVPEIDKTVRDQIITEYNEKGLEWLQEQVKQNDPGYFAVVDQKNPHRLIRALEISRATGIKMADWRTSSKRELDFDVVKIGLTLPVEELYSRIDARMDQMIAMGLFTEAAELYPYRHLQALQTVGYREIFAFMDHSYDRDEAVRLLKRNTRHYAKRQMTWFRKDPEFTWLRPDQWNEIVNLAVGVRPGGTADDAVS